MFAPITAPLPDHLQLGEGILFSGCVPGCAPVRR